MSCEENSSSEVKPLYELRGGLDEMLSYGAENTCAQFQTSAVAKIVQRELEDVATRANHSLNELLLRAIGYSNGSEGFQGKSRALLVVKALASLHGSEFEVVNSLVVISLEKDGDQFQIEPVLGEDLFSCIVINILYRNKLLSEDVYNILTDGIDIGSSKINIGDFIVNEIKEITTDNHMTVTERLESLEESWYDCVKQRLPPDIKLAEVINVDNRNSSLKWRDASDHSKSGWCYNKLVRKVATTRQSDLGNDSEAIL